MLQLFTTKLSTNKIEATLQSLKSKIGKRTPTWREYSEEYKRLFPNDNPNGKRSILQLLKK